MMIYHERTQHGVGKGSFHSGIFREQPRGETLFSYVYDCGGRHDLVEDGIDQLMRHSGSNLLDMLVISHFDRDHIGHISTLMNSFDQVNYVVIPFISKLEELALLFEFLQMDDDEESAFSNADDYATFITNPISWFVERGAVHVIRIGESGAMDDTPEASEPIDPDSRFKERLPLKPSVPIIPRTENQISHAVGFPINLPIDPYQDLQWLFKFHTKPAAEEKVRHVAERLLDITGLGELDPDEDDIHFKVKEKIQEIFDDLDTLKEMQSAIGSTLGSDAANRYSLCMYSGPVADRDEQLGWMGTGDAVLKRSGQGSYVNFRKHYKSLIKNVSTVQAPHHGSEKNYDSFLVGLFANRIWVSSAHSRNRGHPSPELIEQCTGSGCLFVEVNEVNLRYSMYRNTGPYAWHPFGLRYGRGHAELHIDSYGNNFVEEIWFC